MEHTIEYYRNLTPEELTKLGYIKDHLDDWVIRNRSGNIHSYNDEPSVVRNDKGLEWHKSGKNHRVTGPAFITCDDDDRYYINGNGMSKGTWEITMRKLKLRRHLDKSK